MEPLWKPSQERIAQAQISRFSDNVSNSTNQQFCDFDHLHRWSVDNRESFWSAVWGFSKIRGDKGRPPYVVDSDVITKTQWFPQSRLNYAENLLKRRDQHPAIVAYKESGERSTITYEDLYLRVAQLASSLRNEGIEPGDRVAGYLPNCIVSYAAMLATTSLGRSVDLM